jgi:hypothetical protein
VRGELKNDDALGAFGRKAKNLCEVVIERDQGAVFGSANSIQAVIFDSGKVLLRDRYHIVACQQEK